MRRSAIQCFSSAQLQNIANQTLENNVLASEPQSSLSLHTKSKETMCLPASHQGFKVPMYKTYKVSSLQEPSRRQQHRALSQSTPNLALNTH